MVPSGSHRRQRWFRPGLCWKVGGFCAESCMCACYFWWFLADLGRFKTLTLPAKGGPRVAIFASKTDAKTIKNYEKWGLEAPQMHQNQKKWNLERSGRPLGSNLIPGTLCWHLISVFFFLRKEKTDFGSNFGWPVDFEGEPKIMFWLIMLRKTKSGGRGANPVKT